MSERTQRKPDKPNNLISLRLHDQVIEDLKNLAPSLGFKSYQGLIRAYISNGLSNHLVERETHRTKDSTIEKFSRRLMAHGVSPRAIQRATAEMKASR